MDHRTTDPDDLRDTPDRGRVTLPAILGLVALLPVAVIYFAAGLVIPTPALWLVQAAGAALALYGWRQRRNRPVVTATMPVTLVALLILVTSAGDVWLGWTA